MRMTRTRAHRANAGILAIGSLGIGMTIVLFAAELHARDADPALIPGVDEAYQSAIARVGEAKDRAALADAIDRVVALDRGDKSKLVAQLFHYRTMNESIAATQAVVGHVFKRLEDDKPSVVAALVPYLDDESSQWRQYARSLLRGYEDGSAVRLPNYSIYHAILEVDFRAGREPRASLVKFMYEGDPGVALLTMMRASQMRDPAELKPILWAEHVVADLLWRRQFGFVKVDAVEQPVVSELDKLSRHKAWWARLYVAQTIRVHPELGTQAMRERLAGDANDVVRAVVTKS